MLEAWGWGTYIFFAVFLAAGIVWVWLALPETMGATLEDMDKVFGSRTGADDAELLEQARRDVGIENGLLVDVAKAGKKEDQDVEKASARIEKV